MRLIEQDLRHIASALRRAAQEDTRLAAALCPTEGLGAAGNRVVAELLSRAQRMEELAHLADRSCAVVLEFDRT
ncbi:hypothetical protein WV31_10180 [Magnetospirillum sp. ME-1]|uniref:hypothetical protein n=1 Tax=Magnetospirillum sp. ME-1 TaxID=1639348 RepID=UPI000A17C1D3|nr:hypothetical protein [Magnetospirillum sp. ME-1]ARJ65994.1 hypothetical protein WV31_10180 [Magnetospirillum sp. ME-1]